LQHTQDLVLVEHGVGFGQRTKNRFTYTTF